MPTSAACSDGASLIPSPRNPTTCPRRFKRQNDAMFLHGRDAGKHSGCLRDLFQGGVGHAFQLVAQYDAVVSMPTCAQTCRATSSLSPVSTLTCTPSRFRARQRRAGVRQHGIGESTANPANVKSRSSATPILFLAIHAAIRHRQDTESVCHRVVRRSFCTGCALHRSATGSGRRFPCSLATRQHAFRRAPLTMSRCSSPLPTTTESRRRSKSNGTSSIF